MKLVVVQQGTHTEERLGLKLILILLYYCHKGLPHTNVCVVVLNCLVEMQLITRINSNIENR